MLNLMLDLKFALLSSEVKVYDFEIILIFLCDGVRRHLKDLENAFHDQILRVTEKLSGHMFRFSEGTR